MKIKLVSVIATTLLVCIMFSACSSSTLDAIGNDVVDHIENVNSADNLYVNAVKKGNPHAFPTTTYEEAFHNFFASPTWKYFEDDDGKKVVEFTGECFYDGANAKARLQFLITSESEYGEMTFEAHYLSLNDISQPGDIMIALLETAFEESAATTQVEQSATGSDPIALVKASGITTPQGTFVSWPEIINYYVDDAEYSMEPGEETDAFIVTVHTSEIDWSFVVITNPFSVELMMMDIYVADGIQMGDDLKEYVEYTAQKVANEYETADTITTADSGAEMINLLGKSYQSHCEYMAQTYASDYYSEKRTAPETEELEITDYFLIKGKQWVMSVYGETDSDVVARISLNGQMDSWSTTITDTMNSNMTPSELKKLFEGNPSFEIITYSGSDFKPGITPFVKYVYRIDQYGTRVEYSWMNTTAYTLSSGRCCHSRTTGRILSVTRLIVVSDTLRP